jgi:hypothetical protein
MRHGGRFLVYGLIGSYIVFGCFGGANVIIEGTFLGYQYCSRSEIATALVLSFVLFSEISVFCFLLLGLSFTYLLDPSIFIGAIWPPEGSYSF